MTSSSDMTTNQLTLEPTHPRLHFTGDDVSKLREQARGSHARYANLLYEWVDAHASWEPPTVESFEQARTKEVVLEGAAAFLTNVALACVLSQKERYLKLAKSWALAMCDVPAGAPNNYGFGPYVAALGRAYDWLFEQFDPTEQKRLRDHIARVAEGLYLGSFQNTPASQWWAECHLHHDHWLPTGGYGEAALALLGDVAGAETWALRARQEFGTSFSWLGDDGAWLEGPADLCYALAPLLWFYGAWGTVTGEDLHRVPWLERTTSFRLYHRLPDNTYIYTNDSFRSGRYNTSGSASCHLFRRLASVFADPYAQWLAGKDEIFDLKPGPKGVPQAAYEGISVVRDWQEYPEPQAHCAAWNVLWFDPAVEAKPPDDLPLAHHFENQGVSVLRSSWGEDATVVTFSCGPLAGHRAADRLRAGETRPDVSLYHAHCDYNAFTLFTRGRYVLIPPGYARRDSRFQNTVSVDGAQLLPDPKRQPKTLHFSHREAFTYILGDATDVFAPHLHVTRQRRHLLFVPPGHLILYDELERKPDPARFFSRYEWAAHSDPALHSVVLSGARARWLREDKGEGEEDVRLHLLTPNTFAWDRSLFLSTQGDDVLEGLRATVPERYGPTLYFLSALSCGEGAAPVTSLPVQGGDALTLPGAEAWVIVFKHNKTPTANQPIVSYHYGGPHRLLLFGLGDYRKVGLRRTEQDLVEVLPKGDAPVEPGGWLEVRLES